MFTASTRTAHRYRPNANFRSRPRFKLAYAGKRKEFGGPTSCCSRLTTLNGYPVRYSKKPLNCVLQMCVGIQPQTSKRLGVSHATGPGCCAKIGRASCRERVEIEVAAGD